MQLSIHGVGQAAQPLQRDGDLGLEHHGDTLQGVGGVCLPVEPLDAGVRAVRGGGPRGAGVAQVVVHAVQRAVAAGVEPPARLVLLAAAGPPQVVVAVRGGEAHAAVVAEAVARCAIVGAQPQPVVVGLARHSHLTQDTPTSVRTRVLFSHIYDERESGQSRFNTTSGDTVELDISGTRLCQPHPPNTISCLVTNPSL